MPTLMESQMETSLVSSAPSTSYREGLIEQLVGIYEHQETWHDKKLSEEEARAYYDVAISKGRILTSELHEEVIGYVESWRVSYEQFGRILCRLPFNIAQENIETGPIVYLESIWIKPEWRRRVVIEQLKQAFFHQNIQCEFFVGEAFRKRAGMLKVLRRTDATKKWLKKR